MKRFPVVSSNLAGIGYDERASTLEVEFRSGAVYQYFGVPKLIYEGLIKAPSHGRYFEMYVKRAGFRYRRVLG